MLTTPLHFELPENLSIKKFLGKLSKKTDSIIESQQYSIKTFYDSFDWRLFNSGLVCEFNHSRTLSELSLIDRKSNDVIGLQTMQDVPKFSAQFDEGQIKKHLDPILEMRALLSLASLPLEVYHLNILNNNQKIILRIQIDAFEQLTHRIHLYPLKGYEKSAIKISRFLQESMGLKPAQSTVLNTVLKQQGRKAKDYNSKIAIKLNPQLSSDKASLVIYRELLKAIQVNEAGTIADIDTEFLHDFRVAVRRTRAGLNQIKKTLPATKVAHYSDFFAWLGQITSLTRDLDVYLLSYKDYKLALPITLREELAPLYQLLKQKQVLAQKKLAVELKSPHYKKQLQTWEQFLNQPLSTKQRGENANIPIKVLADQRIWKVYQQLIKDGNSINDASPAERLHDLRKVCKKLRYLMEFFQDLYPENKIKMLIKALKNFQTVLGDFQDYEVQEINIRDYSEEMMQNKVPANTLLAMGVLIQHLDAMKCAARNDFSSQFDIFKQAKNQTAFKALFRNGK